MPSTIGRIVTVSVSLDRSRAQVSLGGELDIDVRPDLDEVLERLSVAAPGRVDVDLAAVTYAGSVLPNFLVRVRAVLPVASTITVSDPTPWTSFVLRITDMAEIVKISEARPA